MPYAGSTIECDIICSIYHMIVCRVFIRAKSPPGIDSAPPEIDFAPPKNTVSPLAKKYYYQTLVYGYIALNSMVTSSITVFIT